MRRAARTLFALAAAALVLVVITGRPAGWTAAATLAALAAAGLLSGFGRTGDPVARGRVLLGVLFLASLAHLHAGGGRLGGDGISYYVYVRSLFEDHDLDFTNEYAHYGMLERADIAVPTATGLRRSIFAVGPGILWLPAFAVAEAVARVEGTLRGGVDLSGYGPHHVNAVALASALFGFGAVWLVHGRLARHFPPEAALLATLVVWLGTFLYWYMVQQPAMSHAASTLGAAAAIALWDARRAGRGPTGHLLLGLLLGLAMCLRWQNGLLLLLPAADLLRRLAGGDGTRAVRDGALLGLGVAMGAAPQLVAWKVIYGEWLLRYPPHGADFLRLDRPFVLETLFSSRHGLLSWTPLLWLGYLGFVPLLRRRPALALPLTAPLALMTYVNMCSGDWWAGGSFSNRRFDSLLPILAFGAAASIEWLRAMVVRRPGLVPGALVAASTAWSLAGVALLDAPAGAPTFARAAGHAFRAAAHRVGTPFTWPASWLFAARHDVPPGQYDLASGRYLFYRQNNLQGRIPVGDGDGALLADGWTAATDREGRGARAFQGRARVLAPLDVPEDLTVAVLATADAPRRVRVAVNGVPAGETVTGPGWPAPWPMPVPATAWRRDVNHVVLESDAPVWVAALQLTRAAAPPGEETGFRAR